MQMKKKKFVVRRNVNTVVNRYQLKRERNIASIPRTCVRNMELIARRQTIFAASAFSSKKQGPQKTSWSRVPGDRRISHLHFSTHPLDGSSPQRRLRLPSSIYVSLSFVCRSHLLHVCKETCF